jgi:hypothetical protein
MTAGEFFQKLFLEPYMWIGFVVGALVIGALYMFGVIPPTAKLCAKKHPDECKEEGKIKFCDPTGTGAATVCGTGNECKALTTGIGTEGVCTKKPTV